MIKLLKSDFARLGTNLIFWLGIATSVMTGILCPWSAYYEKEMLGYPLIEPYSMDFHFWTCVNIIAVICAVFCGFFTGIKHRDGILRRELVTGHSRNTVYLAGFVTNVAASCFFLSLYLITELIVGGVFLEPFQYFSRGGILLYTLCAYGMVIAAAGIYTWIASILPGMTVSAVCCIGAISVFLLIGMRQFNSITNYEFLETGRVIWGTYYEAGTANPLWIGGARRSVLLFLLDFLPGGQMIQFWNLKFDSAVYGFAVNSGNKDPWVMLCGSAFFTAVSIAAGLFIFRRKNLR